MLEIMCVTHFIYSGSLCFINEFRGGRKKAYDKWLQDQQLKNPYLIDSDLKLRRKVDKLRRQGLLHQRKDEDRRRNDRRLAYYED